MVMLNELMRSRLIEEQIRARIEAELGQLLQEINESLANHERLAVLVIANEPWSIENGCLTPTLKIKRNRIEAMAAQRIDAWYCAPGPVVWA